MAKLDTFQKGARKTWLAEFESRGGCVLTLREEGVTIAVMPAITLDNPAVMHVAIAKCNMKTDKFKRKYGEWLALSRWFAGEYFPVPTYGRRTAEEIAEMVSGLYL